MWSMWNPPSDRTITIRAAGTNSKKNDEPKYCGHCGARLDQACEEWCYANAPASEPTLTEGTEREPPTGTTARSSRLILHETRLLPVGNNPMC
jgi:hypothetical protein